MAKGASIHDLKDAFSQWKWGTQVMGNRVDERFFADKLLLVPNWQAGMIQFFQLLPFCFHPFRGSKCLCPVDCSQFLAAIAGKLFECFVGGNTCHPLLSYGYFITRQEYKTSGKSAEPIAFGKVSFINPLSRRLIV